MKLYIIKISAIIILLGINYSLAQTDSTLKKIQFPDSTKNNLRSDSTNIIKKKAEFKIIDQSQILDSAYAVFVLTKNEIDRTDYRNAGNFFSNRPFGFLRDLGTMGQPSEVVIYGNGYQSSTFLVDGISLNNRLQNSYDINLFQPEGIEAVEIIPLPRGFLYGTANNSASINFVSGSKNIFKSSSRLRYYQAPDGEGNLNAIFNLVPINKLRTKLEISNQSADSSFNNTEYSNWAASINATYLLSSKIHLSGKYRHSKSKIGLFGGVNIDSIKKKVLPDQVDEFLYNNISALVNFKNRYQKLTSNMAEIRMNGDFIENSPTEIILYNKNDLIEFRLNERGSDLMDGQSYKKNDHRTATLGAQLNQTLKFGNADLRSSAIFESTEFNSPFFNNVFVRNSLAFNGTLSYNFLINNQRFITSVFGKILNYNNGLYSGIGADVIWQLNNFLQLYTGLSSFEKPIDLVNSILSYEMMQNSSKKRVSFESKIIYKEKQYYLSAGYFRHDLNEGNYFSDYNIQGFNLDADIHIWKLLISSNTSYYFNESSRMRSKLPEYTSYGGVYYIDTLFNSNLKLKAGINYSLTGANSGIDFIDFEKSITYPGFYSPIDMSSMPSRYYEASVQFDLFMAATIQDAATIYLVYENLLDSQYMIVPFYPKQPAGLRLGVAWEFLD